MADVNINAAVIESARFEEQAADVATPAAGYWKLFFKDGGLYSINEAGTVVNLIAQDGWVVADAMTYAGADDPTYTMTCVGDLTTKYQAGQRIKLTQATGGTKYFIITKVAYGAPNTTLTLYGGTDYNLENEAISSPFFSSVKAPFGFPLDPTKWTVTLSNTTGYTKATPGAGTWYYADLGSINLSVPIGIWNISFRQFVYHNATSSPTTDMWVALSTANNAASDADLKSWYYVQQNENNIGTYFLHTRDKVLVLTSKTTYYLIGKTDTANCAQIIFRGDVIPTSIRAICAYL